MYRNWSRLCFSRVIDRSGISFWLGSLLSSPVIIGTWAFWLRASSSGCWPGWLPAHFEMCGSLFIFHSLRYSVSFMCRFLGGGRVASTVDGLIVSDGVCTDPEVVTLHVCLQVSSLRLGVRSSLSSFWLHVLPMSLADAYKLSPSVVGADVANFACRLERGVLPCLVLTVLA
jgi:hypothetical protein